MRKLYILLFFSISILATAQRTIRLRNLTPDSFQEQIKSYDLGTCDSLIMDGVISLKDFKSIDAPNVRYLNLKGLLFSEIWPLIVHHDTWIHPILKNNRQQRIGYDLKYHKNLEEVILPDSLKIIGRSSFVGCEKLTKVVLPQGLLIISDVAFRLCSNLEHIDIPESVIAMGGGVFTDTKVGDNKTVVQLPPNLEVIDAIVHTGKNVKRIEIAKENQFFSSVKGVLYDKSHKRLIRVPSRVKRLRILSTTEILEGNAFYKTDIREIKVPDQVKEIKMFAFSSCPNLKSISLPSHDSLKLHYHLFSDSDRLHTIICRSSIPYKNGKEALKRLTKSCIIVVPKGAKGAYEQAEGWQDYRIEEMRY